ncbi:FkbM family methyltransferase [Streptomyces sp. MnatMP-M17]|uniref:FkbM family methyltransferase n=1 Tax=unclassified Streptomyces TaxID=2593676 RepID=UPI00081F4BFE|nr:FkbM family methyltransferase [Streptomyces sp. MnatMP-M17]MYZ39756.1 FkbM family methyltransferase [Streptomyces sp. SID4917]SCG05131.1 methyltransferase, FkbM family [Streptomyces sp. MnatMP-M17]
MKILRKISSSVSATGKPGSGRPAAALGTRIRDLDEANRRTAKEAVRVRPTTTTEILNTHRKAFPYQGWVEIDSGFCPPFVMFCANDEAVALDTVWNGRFGYEMGSLYHWSRLAAASRTVLDVGAHVGYYAMIAALSSPKATVHAFEPVPPIHARLAINHRANGLKNLVLHQKGVSDEGGRADINIRFPLANLLSTGSSLEEFAKPLASAFTARIQLVTLDETLGDTSVDLIKIDVEGHEPSVLEGAQQLIKRDRPVIILEALASTPMDELTGPFADLDYTFRWISEEDQRLVPIAEGRPGKSRNLIFAPRENEYA